MKFFTFLLTVAAGFLTAQISVAEPGFENFITARNGRLLDGAKPYRFISWNIPNLLLIEDRLNFTGTNDWCLPERFELVDALSTVRQMGGTVARTYSISVTRGENPPARYSHVLAPGKFNETAFRALDEALQVANEQGVRLIIPLVNNWPWFGGRGEYAAFRGKTKDDFWTDPQLLADFKDTIKYVLTRTNRLTGVRYLDDKAILCWETGNELRCPADWTRNIAGYIKSLDSNHLVMDGFDEKVRPEVLAMPEIDIVTCHYYPDSNSKKTFAEKIREDTARVNLQKVFIVGEFGFADTSQMSEAMTAICDGNAAGGMLWSLRFRNPDGGFYWHSEPSGGNCFKAFHWPGSTIGAPYDETGLMQMVREKAFAIRGMPVPQLPAPQAPKLLPITSALAISWQGSVGAKTYQVERAPEKNGPWQTVRADVDEAFTQYHPIFADESVTPGKWFYRVRAGNDSGWSAPSNLVGPVKVTASFLVDELADFSKIHSRSGDWKIVDRDCRAAREDAKRAAGIAGDTLVYQLPGNLLSLGLYAFFPKGLADLKFFVSDDGANFRPLVTESTQDPQPPGDYGYWSKAFFHAEKFKGGAYLKIQLTGETQISRVELTYRAASR